MKIMTANDFGKLIQVTRKKAGLTQYELAAASATGERFIRELEKGKVTCQLGKALSVAALLGITFIASTPIMDE